MSLNNATYGTRKPTSPSELDQRITLQYSTIAADGLGGVTDTWTDLATVWAKAWSASSNEGTDRVQKFKIRYRKLMRASWRIKWGSRYFNLVSHDPDERREFLFLTANEVVA
jgi:SPP1 family predicted phage head-tail adaptor